MTYDYPKIPVFRLSTWWKASSHFPFWDDVFMHKAKDLKFPFDQIHEIIQSALDAYLGGIDEQKSGVTEIYTIVVCNINQPDTNV